MGETKKAGEMGETEKMGEMGNPKNNRFAATFSFRRNKTAFLWR